MNTSIVACAVAFGCIAAVYTRRRHRGSTQPTCSLPPGPPGLPWVGNVTGIDKNAPWLTYREWAKTYGDIIHSRLLGKDIIIINSEKIARDLFDDHSSNNSDRPYLITNELCGIGFNTALLAYGDRWRLHRQFFHQTFRVEEMQKFVPFQHLKACQLLRQFFCSPEDFDRHAFQYTASIVLNSAYDYDVTSHDDELVKMVMKLHDIVLSVVRPDLAIILATFPILLKLPAWLPGMSFKTDMAHARKLAKQYVETAFEYSLQRRDCGSPALSMVHNSLRKMEEKGTIPDESWMEGLKEAAATAFLGGSETSHAVMITFFLLMVLNPAVQEKAYAQIIAVVGKDKLPAMDDRASLPYIDAVFRETLRYSPVIPLSVPHSAVNDDVYRGFHIPKGSILLANLWAMGHDESKFDDPELFIPERFLNDDGSLKPNDLEHLAFGFGRRVCAGKHFADTSVWSVIAKVLAVFKILKPLDENGAEIPMESKFSSGISIRPLPFRCRIVPRRPDMDAEKLEELIAASAA